MSPHKVFPQEMWEYPEIVYILSTGHSGSTLLDMMLNAFPEVTATGEVDSLRRYIPYGENDLPPPVKGDWIEVRYNVLKTPFWKRLRKCYEERSDEPFGRLIDVCRYPPFWRLISRTWDRESEFRKRWRTLFTCIADVSGTPIVSDASKSPHRLLLLARSGARLKVIHLIRDGRGVVYSYRRKYQSFTVGFGRWILPTLEMQWLQRKLSYLPWLTVRYEDLVLAPEETLKNIAKFIGIPFHEGVLRLWEVPYLGVGGNRLRENPPRTLVLDERWRKEMPTPERIAFMVLGGWLNRIQGYGLIR